MTLVPLPTLSILSSLLWSGSLTHSTLVRLTNIQNSISSDTRPVTNSFYLIISTLLTLLCSSYFSQPHRIIRHSSRSQFFLRQSTIIHKNPQTHNPQNYPQIHKPPTKYPHKNLQGKYPEKDILFLFLETVFRRTFSTLSFNSHHSYLVLPTLVHFTASSDTRPDHS